MVEYTKKTNHIMCGRESPHAGVRKVTTACCHASSCAHPSALWSSSLGCTPSNSAGAKSPLPWPVRTTGSNARCKVESNTHGTAACVQTHKPRAACCMRTTPLSASFRMLVRPIPAIIFSSWSVGLYSSSSSSSSSSSPTAPKGSAAAGASDAGGAAVWATRNTRCPQNTRCTIYTLLLAACKKHSEEMQKRKPNHTWLVACP